VIYDYDWGIGIGVMIIKIIIHNSTPIPIPQSSSYITYYCFKLKELGLANRENYLLYSRVLQTFRCVDTLTAQ
jgi:hypothetical protein